MGGGGPDGGLWGPHGGLWGPLRVGAFTLCGSCPSAELFSFVHQGKCAPGGDNGVDRQKGLSSSPLHLPPFYSLLSLTLKASGSCRLIIDLSLLTGFVQYAPFWMESNQSVCQSIRYIDWLISIDLKDTYPLVLFSSVQQEVCKVCCRSPSLSVPGSLLRVLKCSQESWLWCHLIRQVVRLLGYFLVDWLVLASSH